MSLTVQQGILAGQYAAAIQSMQAFVTQMQAAQAAGATLTGMYFSFGTQAPIVANVVAGVADTSVLITNMINLANALISEYQANLASM